MYKKHIMNATLASLTAGIMLAMPVFATPMLNWGGEINAGKCDKTVNPVVNVTQKVINSIDSGEGGNYWAFDNFSRNIQVWEQPDGSYCAEVNYQGKFDAQAGEASPGNTGVLDGDEDGTFQGGYRANVTGSLLATPLWKTRGNVGAFDYQCDLAGNCPGAVSWLDQYFASGYGFTYEWWGWLYHAGKNGAWVNSSNGNSGDIL